MNLTGIWCTKQHLRGTVKCQSNSISTGMQTFILREILVHLRLCIQQLTRPQSSVQQQRNNSVPAAMKVVW